MDGWMKIAKEVNVIALTNMNSLNSKRKLFL